MLAEVPTNSSITFASTAVDDHFQRIGNTENFQAWQSDFLDYLNSSISAFESLIDDHGRLPTTPVIFSSVVVNTLASP